MTKGKLETKV